MSFVLSKIFWILVQPLNAVILLILAAFALNGLGRERIALLSLRVGLGLLMTATILPVGQLLLLPIENRFPNPEPLPAHVDGIIALGGGVLVDISERRNTVALGGTAERFTTFLALARRYPDAKLVFSGGNADLLGNTALSEAAVIDKFLVEQGFDSNRVMLESRSRNTWENVEFSLKLAQPQPGETWVLVTSAAHMPRAVGTFRKLGWRVTPYPVDYRTDGGIAIGDMSLLDRVDEFDMALREWLGLFAYYAMGRTTTLFPAP